MKTVLFIIFIFSPCQLKSTEIIMKDLSWKTKMKLFDLNHTRRVGLGYLQRAEDKTSTVDPSKDDNSMKIKLFRLMYETIRDSDVKVRRAELIKSHYSNSTAFEVGFIIGDINDKFNVMTDIAKTLERLYKEWTPMEHINAYEQIANKGIEISHLLDIIKVVSKKNSSKT